MFEGCFEAEIQPPDQPDVDKGELLADPLSWRLNDIDNEVGGKGWKDKFNIGMVVQLVLMIYYAVIYSVTFIGINAYYEWPLPNIDNITEPLWGTPRYEVLLNAILTDEESFVCEDREFYLNETGPILDVNNLDIVYDNADNDLVQALGYYWGLLIAFFASFIVIRLRSGQFNQLLLLVKFKKDKKDGKIKPQKMSFAWTIMCNAKTFSSIAFKNLCDDRMAFYTVNWNRNLQELEGQNSDEVLSSKGIGATEILALIFVLAWSLILLWIILYIFTCGNCCGRVNCMCSKSRHFMWFRILITVNVIVMFTAWVVNFDPSLEFDFERPVLSGTNIVAWCDLVVNIVYDIYDASRRVRSCGARVTNEVEDEEQESPPAQDKEQDEQEEDCESPSGELPPAEMSQQRSFHAPQPYRYLNSMDANKVRKTVTQINFPDGTKKITETILNSDGSKTVTITTERPTRLDTAYQPAGFVRSSSSLSI